MCCEFSYQFQPYYAKRTKVWFSGILRVRFYKKLNQRFSVMTTTTKKQFYCKIKSVGAVHIVVFEFHTITFCFALLPKQQHLYSKMCFGICLMSLQLLETAEYCFLSSWKQKLLLFFIFYKHNISKGFEWILQKPCRGAEWSHVNNPLKSAFKVDVTICRKLTPYSRVSINETKTQRKKKTAVLVKVTLLLYSKKATGLEEYFLLSAKRTSIFQLWILKQAGIFGS